MAQSPSVPGLDARYAEALAQLAADQGMSELNVVRAALRVYQLVHARAKDGARIAFVDAEGKLLPETAVRLRFKASGAEQ